MRRGVARRKRYVFFAIGAAFGSACGFVVGSLLAFWFGEGTVRTIQRGLRRLTGHGDGPSFDLLIQ